MIGTLCLSELQPTVQVQAVLGGFAKVTCTPKAMFIGAYADSGTTDVQSAVKLDLQRGKFTFATKKERQTYLAAPFRLENPPPPKRCTLWGTAGLVWRRT